MISHTALCQNALAPFRNEGVLLCLFFKHFCREYNNIIQCCSLIVADILKLNSNLSMRKKFLPRVMIRGFFFVFSGAIFGIRWFESFCRLNGSISKKSFLAFRGFGSSRRRDGSVLEGTICKQFVMSVKNRKNLKPCRGFKSFRSLAFRIQFLKNRIFGSSNPSTRRKIENGSMETYLPPKY